MTDHSAFHTQNIINNSSQLTTFVHLETLRVGQNNEFNVSTYNRCHYLVPVEVQSTAISASVFKMGHVTLTTPLLKAHCHPRAGT